MKKILFCGALLAIAGVVRAESDAPILNDLKPGQYVATTTDAADPASRGKSGKLTVQRTPDGVLCTFVADNASGKAREEWLVQGADLTQKEYDANGRVQVTFKGEINPDRPLGNAEATFVVACTDRTKNVCTSNLDARTARTLTVQGKAITYTAWGVPKPLDRGNPAAPVVKQRELVFRTQ